MDFCNIFIPTEAIQFYFLEKIPQKSTILSLQLKVAYKIPKSLS